MLSIEKIEEAGKEIRKNIERNVGFSEKQEIALHHNCTDCAMISPIQPCEACDNYREKKNFVESILNGWFYF
jgi:recombinational DNA repair protein RecR